MPGFIGTITGVLLVSALPGLFPPLTEAWNQKSFSWWPNRLPSLGDLIEQRYRGAIDEATFYEETAKLGFSKERADNVYFSSHTLLNVGDIIRAWRRELVTEEQLTEYLSTLRFSDDDMKTLKSVSEYFPSPADLIQFGVREVYSPEIVTKFGQMEDLPPKFITEAKKAGLPEEQAKNHWAAHWALPGVSQGFEMLHRRIIEQEELNLLMRALDIMPYWRDKLVEISYNPLTRVDVRRMYSLGVLNEEGVKNAYLDGGYNEENAQLMLEFTKKYESKETVGLSRSVVMKAYKENLISLDQLQIYLEMFDYPEEVVKFWLTMAEYEKEKSQVDDIVDEMVTRYRMGELNIEGLRDELNKMDLPSPFVNTLINNELLKISKKRKLPTRSDLTNWLELSIINEKIFSTRMTQLGYRKDDVETFLTEITAKQDTETVKLMGIDTYKRWTVLDIISKERFIEVAKEKDISEQDIEAYTQEIKALVVKAEAKAAKVKKGA